MSTLNSGAKPFMPSFGPLPTTPSIKNNRVWSSSQSYIPSPDPSDDEPFTMDFYNPSFPCPRPGVIRYTFQQLSEAQPSTNDVPPKCIPPYLLHDTPQYIEALRDGMMATARIHANNATKSGKSSRKSKKIDEYALKHSNEELTRKRKERYAALQNLVQTTSHHEVKTSVPIQKGLKSAFPIQQLIQKEQERGNKFKTSNIVQNDAVNRVLKNEQTPGKRKQKDKKGDVIQQTTIPDIDADELIRNIKNMLNKITNNNYSSISKKMRRELCQITTFPLFEQVAGVFFDACTFNATQLHLYSRLLHNLNTSISQFITLREKFIVKHKKAFTPQQATIHADALKELKELKDLPVFENNTTLITLIVKNAYLQLANEGKTQHFEQIIDLWKKFNDLTVQMNTSTSNEALTEMVLDLEEMLEEKFNQFKRKQYNTIAFLGELYTYGLIQPNTILLCLHSLLEDPAEADVDMCCVLLHKAGKMLDNVLSSTTANSSQIPPKGMKCGKNAKDTASIPPTKPQSQVISAIMSPNSLKPVDLSHSPLFSPQFTMDNATNVSFQLAHALPSYSPLLRAYSQKLPHEDLVLNTTTTPLTKVDGNDNNDDNNANLHITPLHTTPSHAMKSTPIEKGMFLLTPASFSLALSQTQSPNALFSPTSTAPVVFSAQSAPMVVTPLPLPSTGSILSSLQTQNNTFSSSNTNPSLNINTISTTSSVSSTAMVLDIIPLSLSNQDEVMSSLQTIQIPTPGNVEETIMEDIVPEQTNTLQQNDIDVNNDELESNALVSPLVQNDVMVVSVGTETPSVAHNTTEADCTVLWSNPQPTSPPTTVTKSTITQHETDPQNIIEFQNSIESVYLKLQQLITAANSPIPKRLCFKIEDLFTLRKASWSTCPPKTPAPVATVPQQNAYKDDFREKEHKESNNNNKNHNNREYNYRNTHNHDNKSPKCQSQACTGASKFLSKNSRK